MAYAITEIDKKNSSWFDKDETRASLKSLAIVVGEIRGLRRMKLQFEYPITAIAGRNGSGKTTVLAMAACAFHARRNSYSPQNRKNPYYTFSDFFIQARNEVPLSGIIIRYSILFDKWAKSDRLPNGRGLGYQQRSKKLGGRWNNYDRRVNRPVVYVGIERLVPHSERSVSRSYRNKFKSVAQNSDWVSKACSIASRVLSRSYSNIEYSQHSKYRLPFVSRGSLKYSGFNMGAGEDALFELLSYALECPMGTLLLIDEIELGLHPEAQYRLITELKKIVLERKLQIICTTHSPWILESIPPSGRFFIERLNKDAVCLPRISADFAMGKLLGTKKSELDIFVEDDIASAMVEGCLSRDQRMRVRILPIGSAVSIARNLAARFIDDKKRKTIAFFDGDQRNKFNNLKKKFLDALELPTRKEPGEQWIKNRLHFLPGDDRPELQLLTLADSEDLKHLATSLRISEVELAQLLEEARLQGKHLEVKYLQEQLELKKDVVLRSLVLAYFEENSEQREQIEVTVEGWLNS